MPTLIEQAEALTQKAATLRSEAVMLAEKSDPTPADLEQVKRATAEADEIDAKAGDMRQMAETADRNRAALAGYAQPVARKTGSEVREPIVARAAVLDDPKRGFENFADFAAEVMDTGSNLGAIQKNGRLMAAAGTGMTQGVTAEGGVLVPPAFSTQVWDGARQQSNSLLQFCDVQMIDPGVQSVTIPAVNETDRATGSRWGGVRGYWKAELTAMTESRPKFRDVKLEPQELYVLGYISDKLLRNAPGTASGMLAKAAADEINFMIGDSIINGDGAGKPRGFLTHGGTVSQAKETGQAAATITKANIDNMWARCHANWRSGAVWFINQTVEPQLETLSATVGTGGVPVYLPAGGVADTPNARLKGRPVIPIEYCAALGTVGDIVLANLSAYAVGLRGMVDQGVSMHLKFDYAQTAFRFIFEVDGQPWLASPITPFKGSNTLSPFVTLATRS